MLATRDSKKAFSNPKAPCPSVRQCDVCMRNCPVAAKKYPTAYGEYPRLAQKSPTVVPASDSRWRVSSAQFPRMVGSGTWYSRFCSSAVEAMPGCWNRRHIQALRTRLHNSSLVGPLPVVVTMKVPVALILHCSLPAECPWSPIHLIILSFSPSGLCQCPGMRSTQCIM